MNRITVTAADIRARIRQLGLGSKPLCVHSSLRSFGWVEGGAATVVRALLDEGCTVLVPTFASAFEAPPPPGSRRGRNGTRYEPEWLGGFAAKLDEPPLFSTESKEIDSDMGAIPAAILATPGRLRGDHPIESFAAVGPKAHDLIDAQSPADVYAPFDALIRLNGQVLCMGVGLNRITLLHLAEQRAGRRLFIRWAFGGAGEVIEVESGGCSEGFVNVEPVLAPLRREARVGQSLWAAYPAAGLVQAAAEAIRRDPAITHCGRNDCLRCDDAVAGGPVG